MPACFIFYLPFARLWRGGGAESALKKSSSIKRALCFASKKNSCKKFLLLFSHRIMRIVNREPRTFFDSNAHLRPIIGMPKLRSRIFDKFILNPACEPLATSDEPRARIMQNKPNFLNTKNNLNLSNNNDYELRTTNYELFKNKAKRTQFMVSKHSASNHFGNFEFFAEIRNSIFFKSLL
jgi:hypothetical protein